jgi:hypothetical protein
VNNIEMELRERERELCGMDWTDVAQDRDRWRALVNRVMSLQVPQNSGNFFSGCTTGGLSGSAQLHGMRYPVTNNFFTEFC